MADILAQHPPAVKVGGRRLSISTKPKHHAAPEPAPAEPTPASDNADYPRPVPHDDQVQAPPHIEEEAPPKREKKHWNQEHERQLKELAHRKAETTRPTKESINSHKGFGAAGRIAQPAGKSLHV